MRDREPWITFEARDFLDLRIDENMSVFEYGSGGSTLYFSDRVKRVITVENDPEWAETMKRLLANENNGNVEFRLVEGALLPAGEVAQPGNPSLCHSGSANYSGYEFSNYVSVIDEFNDETFDIVLIDGRARAACIRHAIPKLRPGGILVLDNSDRDYYTGNLSEELARWKKHAFFGPIPYIGYFVETTCWVKPFENVDVQRRAT